MRRKKIVAKMLALSLALSGLPMTPLYAAELPVSAEAGVQENVDDPVGEQAGDTDRGDTGAAGEDGFAEQEKETQDGEQAVDGTQQDASENHGDQDISGEDGAANNADQTDTQTTAVEGKKALEIAADAKMAGSDGVFHEDVTYLSARNVMAMSEDMQELYRNLCDGIASSRDSGLDLEDVVFAVDADGNLYCSYYVPAIVLEEIQKEFLPDTDEVLSPAVEEGTEKLAEDTVSTAEEEKKEDEASNEGTDVSAGEEKKDEATSDEVTDSAEEEKKDDETSEDGKDTTEEEKKDSETPDGDTDATEGKDNGTSNGNTDATEEEKKDDETSADEDGDVPEEGKQDDEAVDPEQDTPEEEGKDQEEPEEELVVFEENMDVLPDAEEETFEEIESVRIENTLDLGYGSGVSEGNRANGIQFNSVLPSEDYFVKQLTEKQKKYYNAAKGKLTKGSNQFTVQEALSESSIIVDNVAHATSALILAYPDKTDWMAKPGGFDVKGYYYEGSTVGNFTFTYDKSEFYSGTLDTAAKDQVQSVGNLAVQYAASEYPNAPVYGIVRYLDQWVCENGFYEMLGTMPLTGDKIVDKVNLEVDDATLNKLYNIYYHCHSAYGILLGGFGVCESYAKTMSRLLDAVGIPNLYVVGVGVTDSGAGGHAWNYVQMPNGKWYLLDSTWNDTTNPGDTVSNKSCLLVKDDGKHLASGCNYGGEKPDFTFPALDNVDYTADNIVEFSLNMSECTLLPKEKVALTLKGNNSEEGYGAAPGVWTSSNTKVAKVDQKGNVTAVAAGEAEITFSATTIAGMSARCTVYVDQIKTVKVKETNKTSENVSLGIDGDKKDSKSVVLAVDMGSSLHDAAWMIQNDKVKGPEITYSKQNGVAKAEAKVEGNDITVTVTAEKAGSVNIPVKFGGKTVTIKVSAGKFITEDMFDITWPAEDKTEDGKRCYAYTGKAVKPSIKKKTDAAYKPVKFKVTYVNNKDAGEAKAVITGTGQYGGVIEYSYMITPIDITSADFSKTLKSKVYNGGANPPSTVVKLGKKTLKANKDYEILYTSGNGVVKEPLAVVPAGDYTITIRGKGNYTGEVNKTLPYSVTKNTIAKVSVAGSSSVKYTGAGVNPFTVKIGKNVLTSEDYKITWHEGQGNTMKEQPMQGVPILKGKYTAVVTVQGNNLTTTGSKTEIVKKLTIK